MLQHSLPAALAVRGVRRFRERARHHRLIKRSGLHYSASADGESGFRAHDLLRRAEDAAPWVPRPLYPAGGAAEPLVLYLLVRALSELPVRRVLELGAGQTSRVLGAWAREGDGRQVVTFEHDEWWAGRVRDDVGGAGVHVHHLPLEPIETPAGPSRWYAAPPAGAVPDDGFDLVVVDGPVGAQRFSRYGIVEHLPAWCASDWAVIWDDLHRAADLESFAALVERLRAQGVEHGHRILDGVRTVGIAFSPSFSALNYMW